MTDSVLVWDAGGSPPSGEWATTFLWCGFTDNSNSRILSIPKLVEDLAPALKAQYLGWIYELGERDIAGRRLLDHLELRPGFSYWWMTLIAEKCNWAKSPQINNAIRLIALNHLLSGRSIDCLTLVSSNSLLAESIQSLCDSRGIDFKWQRIKSDTLVGSWPRRLYGSLPKVIQAIVWLVIYLIRRWPLRGVGLKEWQQTTGTVTFISYLFNLVPDSLIHGRFESRYWAHLPEVMKQDSCETNWLHVYVSDAVLPSSGKAADAVRQFNLNSQGKQNHATLDAFLDLSVVLRTLRDWLRLVSIGRRISPILFEMQKNGLELWPLHNEDWAKSVFGRDAIRSLLMFNLYEAATKSLPRQRAGVYLYENDPTEFALIYTWKAAGHGQLIGAQHSTMLYWDLRYFFDPRCYEKKNRNDLPQPDLVAVNGPAARETSLQGGYPVSHLVEVEALRYLYLEDAVSVKPARTPRTSERWCILVLTDYLPEKTGLQLRMLEAARPLLPDNVTITVKPHPGCPIQPSDYPGLDINVTTQALPSLMEGCDSAFTSNATSATVDAYCAGVSVVSLLDPKTMNLSPLRGCDEVLFVSTPQDLANALGVVSQRASWQRHAHDYFTIDSNLPRWRKLLSGVKT